MNAITCEICHYTYGAWRTHCPACSTLSINVIGKKWSTRKDGIIHRPIRRARHAAEVEQVFGSGQARIFRSGLVD